MNITSRPYNHEKDYSKIGDFLIRHYQTGNLDGNLIEPAWEYMHFHPFMDSSALGRFRIWENDGQVIAVVHYEWQLGEAFFEFHPDYRFLREEMLDYAESNLSAQSDLDGKRYLNAYVNDIDPEFLAVVQSRGYQPVPDLQRPMYHMVIPHPFPEIELPEGFRLTSLAEEPDWAKVHQVLWRGFDHGDQPPMNDEEFESRRHMFDTPKARRDLKIAVAAPNGDFVAFCGMFYESNGHFAYVEPVATDPRYRRLGLGKAAVLEGIRRCAMLGAVYAYVGNDLVFYKAMGFQKVHITECWKKVF
jgi:GNAT superfamily N-acetyltransferase